MDPLGLVLAVPWSVVALLLLIVLPGAALGPILAPGPLSPIERLGRTVGSGMLVGTAAMLGLAAVGMLRPTIVVALLVGLTVLPLHGRRPDRPGWMRVVARRRRPVAAGLAAAAVVVAPAMLAGPGGGLGRLPAEWAGANAAVALATSGGLPIVAPAWAAERMLIVTELPGVSHLAATLQLLPGDIFVRLSIDRLAMTVGVLVVAGMLLRRWLPTWAALLGAALFVGVGGSTTPLLDDPAASRTIGLSLFALWLTDRALVERRGRLAVGAGLAGALVVLGSPESFLATCAGITGLAAARWLVAPGGGPESAGGLGHRHGRRIGLRLDLRRRTLAPLGAALVVVAIAGGVGGVADRLIELATPGGDVLGAVSSGGSTDEPFAGVDEVPDDWRESGDDAWDFHRAAVEPAAAADAAPRTEADPRFVAAAAAGLLALAGTAPIGLPLVVGGALVLPLAGWSFLDARRQRLVCAWAVFGAALAILAVAVLLRGGSFADRWLGATHLLPFEWLVASGALALAAWLAGRVLRRAVARGLGRRAADSDARRRLRVGVLSITMAAAVVIGAAIAVTARSAVDRPGALSERGVAVYDWIGRVLPPDARILANASTGGVIAAVTGRTGILDGPVAADDDRPLLARATALALGARVVFAEPGGTPAAAYLAREGVSHLMVAVPGTPVADVGGRVVFETDLVAIAESDRFALVRSFDDRVLLFELVAPP